MLPHTKSDQENHSSQLAVEEHAPRQYSFRASAALTAKLVAIAGSLLASLWMLDIFLGP